MLGVGDKMSCAWFLAAANSRLGFIVYIFSMFVSVVTTGLDIQEHAEKYAL